MDELTNFAFQNKKTDSQRKKQVPKPKYQKAKKINSETVSTEERALAQGIPNLMSTAPEESGAARPFLLPEPAVNVPVKKRQRQKKTLNSVRNSIYETDDIMSRNIDVVEPTVKSLLGKP